MKTIATYDVCIIGAGIIGTNIALTLSKLQLKIICLEKNYLIANETTAGNSGIIHGGFDAKPGTLAAQLNVKGRKLYEQLFQTYNIPHLKIDTLVIAFNAAEKQLLKDLLSQGLSNGLTTTEIKILNQKAALIKQPNLNPNIHSALLCTASYIVDPVLLTNKLMTEAIKNGITLKTAAEVTKITFQEPFFVININNGTTIKARKIVNAAGHSCAKIAALINCYDFKLTTRRGQYLTLLKNKNNYTNNLVFMIPTIYGKGVLVGPTLSGEIIIGPTAKENVPLTETRIIETSLFLQIKKIAKKIIPTLQLTKITKTYAGSRSIIPGYDDFWIKPASNNNNLINVAGIKSPGLSAAPAIAEVVAKLIFS